MASTVSEVPGYAGDGDAGIRVHNLGHNHPAIIAVIKDELDRMDPAMLQSHVPERPGGLAIRLCQLAGGHQSTVFFCSSSSEGAEPAGSSKKSLIQTSTYSENGLARWVGLAALDILKSENAGPRAQETGGYLRSQLCKQLAEFDIVEVTRTHIDKFVSAIRPVVVLANTPPVFRGEVLGSPQRAINI